MDSLTEMSDALRRASFASSIKRESIAKRKLSTKEPPPKDTLGLVYLLFLLFGIASILPLSFFTTAYSYWMYKFRDISSEDIDLNNKTTLQTYFAPGTMVSNSIPSVTCMLLSTAFGHKARMRPKILSSMSIVASLFIFFTIMIEVNTDSWQNGFFVVTLIGLATISGVLTLFQVSTLTLIAKFPQMYMHPFLVGQGISGICNACLQIISLSIGSSIKASAMIYFVSGSTVIVGTLTLYAFSGSLPLFTYYLENNVGEERSKMLTKTEIKDILKDIWPCACIAALIMMHCIMLHPAITSLVVSDNYGYGYTWNDTYFVPAITFLFNDTTGLVGRFLARKGWITPSTKLMWVIIVAVKCIVFTPLIMLCNAQPRSHLPVWFPDDWEYIVILMAFSITNGFIFNVVFLSIPVLATGKEEMAFVILSCCFGISGGVFSPLSLLSVRLL